MKLKKITFFGLYGQRNLGNDCTLKVILENMRRYLPDAEFQCVCTGPENVSSRYNISTFPAREVTAKANGWRGNKLVRLLRKILIRMPIEIIHWIKGFKYLKGSDMLAMAGTGLLVDDVSGPFGFPYYILKWSILAKLRGCKLLFVSVGAGPIYHPLSRWFIKSAISLADYRTYRDDFSKQYIKGLGADTGDDLVYPDLAFSMPMSMFSDLIKDDDAVGRVVGVGLMDYKGQGGFGGGAGGDVYGAYIKKMASFVTWLIENNYTVRVIIGDARYDQDAKEDLMKLLEVQGIKEEDGHIFNEPISTKEDLLREIAKSDVVISPRFHNIIFAMIFDKPVMSISYNEKFDELMKDFGLEEYCQHIDVLDVGWLIKQFKKIMSSREEIKASIRHRMAECRRSLDNQYNCILNDLF